MQEALAKVKEEMGPDAVILKSRKSTRKVLGKTLPCFEVTAALDESLFARPATPALPALPSARPMLSQPRAPAPAPVRPKSGRVGDSDMYDWKGSLRRVDEDGAPSRKDGRAGEAGRAGEGSDREAANPGNAAAASPEAKSSQGLIELLRTEIKEMKDRVDMPTREIKVLKDEIKAMLDASARMKGRPSPFGEAVGRAGEEDGASTQPRGLEQRLLSLDLDPDLAADLARSMPAVVRHPHFPDGSYAGAGREVAGREVAGREIAGREAAERAENLLLRRMAERIRTTGGIKLRPGRPVTIVLVGPTGVGKTTTLAKLASIAKLHQGKKVGIVAADCFRMGANEQLEIFGRTAGIPVRPVFSAADAAEAMRAFADRDLILVDTAGRSHSRKENWAEFQTLLKTLRPDEMHLVLSCSTRMRELGHQHDLYRDLGADSLIFTKLDECLSLGCMYNLVRRTGTPLSYLCNGQVIPDHILLARPETVAAAVLSGGQEEMTAEAR